MILVLLTPTCRDGIRGRQVGVRAPTKHFKKIYYLVFKVWDGEIFFYFK
jgi:hypothetical protein